MKRTSNRSKATSYIPEGFHTVTPYLIVDGAERFIEFTKSTFDAKVTYIMKQDNGRVRHATVQIGDSSLMLSDSMEGMEVNQTMLFLYVKDVDAVFTRATEAGARSIREPLDEFYGDRAGAVKDEWNNTWWIATHQEDVSPAELERRAMKAQNEREANKHAVAAGE
jgi:PhnB protein